MNHVCLPLPPCPHGSMKRGGGTPPRSVVRRGKPPPLSLLWRVAWEEKEEEEESSQPQPDPLEGKSPPSPNQLRLKISSCHHVDDWGVEGEDRVPSPAPSPPQAKRRREEREQGMDRTRAPDFQEKSARCRSPPRERPQLHGRNRRTAPARPQFPPVRALPAGDSCIHWGLIHPYDAQTEFGEHVTRPRNQASRHNSVANSVWQ